MGIGGGFQPDTPVQRTPEASSESELPQLQEALQSLRQKLAETMARIEELESK
jgi:hypothetical protein